LKLTNQQEVEWFKSKSFKKSVLTRQ